MSDGLINARTGLTEDSFSLAEPNYDFHANSSSCINDGTISNSKDSPAVGLGTSCSQLYETMTVCL